MMILFLFVAYVLSGATLAWRMRDPPLTDWIDAAQVVAMWPILLFAMGFARALDWLLG